MRKKCCYRLFVGMAIAWLLLATLWTGPGSAQGARIACEQSFSACSDECVRQGVITAKCFNACRRGLRLCSVRQLVLPSRPTVRSTPAPAVGDVQ